MSVNLDEQQLTDIDTKYLSYSYPIENQKLNELFAKASNAQGERFFWQSADEHVVYLGLHALEVFQNTDFAQIQAFQTRFKEQCTLLSKDQLPPILFGGFAFDTNGAREEFWQELENGYFVLPKILFTQKAGQTWVTLTSYNQENVRDCLQELAAEVSQLLSAKLFAESLPAVLETEELAIDDWLDLVAESISAIKSEQFAKVVLARQMKISQSQTFDFTRILNNLLAQQPNTYVFILEGPTRSFIGATPERLIEATPEFFASASVAGSTPRGETQEADELLGKELLNDSKNSHEHQLVVQRIELDFAPFIENIQLGTRSLLKNRDIQHIYQPLFGTRKPDVRLLEVIQALHPTPALGGEPRMQALDWIAKKGNNGRGLYGAPIGWLNLIEDTGEFAVGLRSGVFSNTQALFYAGCGIVADSVPETERQETRTKFQPMLRGVQ